VEPLRRWLVGQGFDVISAADRIAFTRRVDRDLGRLFAVVLALTGTGYAATLWLTQVAAVERKRRVLAVLRLLGYGPRAVGSFPLVQGAALALAGSLLAVIVYLAVEPAIGALFRDLVESEGRLTRLPAAAAGVAVAASVGVAMMASLGAARRATRISPAESLRDA
jgi:putative ABC transport system permease protein